MQAVYYSISSYELGIASTGKRSSNYCCYCEIYDAEMGVIRDHFLKDIFHGKWPKCERVIKTWRQKCEKNKLIPVPTT